MAERVIPFDSLAISDILQIDEKGANWCVDSHYSDTDPVWTEIVDKRYGRVRHVALIDGETGKYLFDKIDLDWKPAAFVVVYRQKEDRTEFLLPTERRILLKDENGAQGNVSIRNIPQGLVHTWRNETPEEAALREVKEETGLVPKNIYSLGEIYFDAANSSSAMPFFIAEVDAGNQNYEQQLDEAEHIKVGEEDWFAVEDIPSLKLQCAKTMAGLFLATGYLGFWNEQSVSGKTLNQQKPQIK